MINVELSYARLKSFAVISIRPTQRKAVEISRRLDIESKSSELRLLYKILPLDPR
jgi:hypothetical protein